MSNHCSFCVYTVHKCLQCNEWIHYSCSKLLAYMRKLLVNRMVSSSLPPPVKHSPLSHCLPQPPPHLTIKVSPKPLSPSAPLLTCLVAPTPPHPNLYSNTPQPPSPKNQLHFSSPANSICRGNAKMGERAPIVSTS